MAADPRETWLLPQRWAFDWGYVRYHRLIVYQESSRRASASDHVAVRRPRQSVNACLALFKREPTRIHWTLRRSTRPATTHGLATTRAND
jgi:hypothetical protein